jgi:predicted Fe-Mo cluster-binding NifX family protein
VASKVALTVWEGRISPVFDVAREAQILEIEDGEVLTRSTELLDALPLRRKVDRLVQRGVETLICGAITGLAQAELTARGIEVIGFVAGESDRVAQAYLDGRLDARDYAMPGCARRRRRRRGRSGPGRPRPPQSGAR